MQENTHICRHEVSNQCGRNSQSGKASFLAIEAENDSICPSEVGHP